MIAVTGASGFVGSEIVRRLGAAARGVQRRDAPTWSTAELAHAIEGCHSVVHAASVVHRAGAPASEYQRFNVEGTHALVEAARAAGAKRFVFLSSIKVHGETPGGVIDESTPIRPDADYARTKAEAERIVLAAEDLRPVILRLCPVFGRGDKGNVRAMIRNIHRRTFLVPGDGSTRKSIVHVSTVAAVVERALAASATGCFVVADRVTPTIRELADEIARVLARRRPLGVPRGFLLGMAGLVERAARASGVKTGIGRALIEKATSDSLCNPAKVEAELGIDCHVDLGEALRDETAWLREIGAI